MQSTKTVMALLLAAVILSSATAALGAPDTPLPAGVVALVNGTPIPESEFDSAFQRVSRQAEAEGQPLAPERTAEIKERVLTFLVRQELLFQESRRAGVVVDPATVEAQFADMQRRFEAPADFQKALADNNLTEAGLRAQIEKRLAIQKLMEEQVLLKIEISEAQSKDFFDNNPNYFTQPEEVRARHILVKVEPQADEAQKAAARKKIEAVQARLKAGEDFAELARTESEGPSAAQGGDLGYFNREQMVKPFADAAFSLATGAVSDLVVTQFGYHLIKVLDHKAETKLKYEEVKERLVESLREQQAQKESAVFIEKLEAQAAIQRRLP